MRLKIITTNVSNVDNAPCGFGVEVRDADTGALLPYVQKVVLTLDTESFATATITVAGVLVETAVAVPETLAALLTRQDLAQETLQRNGAVYDADHFVATQP